MKPLEIKQVLAAVDFSDWTPSVLMVATEVAQRYEAELTVLYAEMLYPPAYCGEEALLTIRNVMDSERERARNHLAEVADKAIGDKVPYKVRVMVGVADQCILTEADEIGAGLIVLGTHGRSGVSRLLMGSVAEKVVREATVPVLTVHGVEKEQEPFKKILCPINYTDASRESLDYATDIAHRSGAELVVMHVLEDEPEALSKAVRAEEQKLYESLPADVRTLCHPRAVIRYGDAAEQVLREATDGEYDLIVIGAQHKRLMESTIFGTTSVRVMRHANKPVFTVVRH